MEGSLESELTQEVTNRKGNVVKDSNAVHCTFHRKSKKLDIQHGTSHLTVECIQPPETDESKANGPTPLGNYLIDKKRYHEDHHLDWFNLHQQFPDGTGYFGYGRGWVARNLKPFRRANFGLHPGGISLGCVTVKSSDWKSAVAILDKGDLTYDGSTKKGQKFVGYLTVLDD